MSEYPHQVSTTYPGIPTFSRRQLMKKGLGIGTAAIAGLLARDGLLFAADGERVALRGPNLLPRAKRVIYLYMAGGPSHVDTFDPKPQLNRLDGGDVPESIAKFVPRIK